MLRIALASIHLLGFGMAVGAIYSRARAFNTAGSPDAIRRGFVADNWWGISALVLIGTGLWRALGSLEKTSSYYWTNTTFIVKMSLFVLVFALEIWPMVTLIRWRTAQGKGTLPEAAVLQRTGKGIARISDIQTLLLVCIVVAAVMMARGYGAR